MEQMGASILRRSAGASHPYETVARKQIWLELRTQITPFCRVLTITKDTWTAWDKVTRDYIADMAA
jgi:hypothetical protein